MPSKETIVALIGQGRGPWVYTGRSDTPVLEVCGSEKHVVTVEMAHRPDEETRFNIATFDHKHKRLEKAQFMRVTYSGEAKNPICRIHSR